MPVLSWRALKRPSVSGGCCAKGGFFSESAIRFSNLQNENIPKNYLDLEI